MRTATVLVSTVLLGASLVSGCGSSGGISGNSGSSSAYCKDLKAAKTDFASLQGSTPDFNKLDDAFAAFHGLAKKAPSEISAEWKTLDGAITSLEATLKSVGLSAKDLGALVGGTLPEGMTAEDLQELGPKLQTAFADLDNEEFSKATDKIEKNAKSECDVDLTSD
jgi:hypothetical protein